MTLTIESRDPRYPQLVTAVYVDDCGTRWVDYMCSGCNTLFSVVVPAPCGRACVEIPHAHGCPAEREVCHGL